MQFKFDEKPIPVKAGIGFRYPHYKEILTNKPPIEWLELHSENFFSEGGIVLEILKDAREIYPFSFHGVGLSLGSAEGLKEPHLKKLKTLVDNFNPGLVSEHISWGAAVGVYLNDLLPLPYTKESLEILVQNIKHTQDYIGRQILVENPSTYLQFKNSEMSEYEFIAEVCEKSGCGLLLDVNNVYVSAQNHKFDAHDYIRQIPTKFVQEIHLAGHSKCEVQEQTILIDNHGDYVADQVWDLYKFTLKHIGKVPTLIEWDTNIPSLSKLLKEAHKIQIIIDNLGEESVAA